MLIILNVIGDSDIVGIGGLVMHVGCYVVGMCSIR